MRQFKIERAEARIEISLPVRLSAIDASGHPFDEDVTTINVSRKGALLASVRGKLRVGSKVSLSRRQKQEQFLIAWIGKENTPEAGHVGLSAVDHATSFWSDVVETESPSEAQREKNSSERVPVMQRARAQGA